MADTNERPVISVSTAAHTTGGVRPPTPQQADTSAETVSPATTVATGDPKLEVFARKEKQLRAQQRQLQAEKQAWEAERTKYQTEYMPKSRLTEDPIGVLSESGIGLDKLSELLLNTPASANDPTIRALKAEIASIKASQEQAKQQTQEAVTQQYQQAIKQISNEVKLLVDSDSQFNAVKSMGMQEAVTELIEQTFNKEGYLMDISDAAKKVEEFLRSEHTKVQNALNPPAPVSAPAKPAVTSQGIKTLTNSVSQQVSKRPSDREKRERAIAAFYGQLKS